jgi:hypothetical protein
VTLQGLPGSQEEGEFLLPVSENMWLDVQKVADLADREKLLLRQFRNDQSESPLTPGPQIPEYQ